MKPKGRYFNLKPSLKIHRKFQSIKLNPKSKKHLDELLQKRSNVKKLIGNVFSKKGLAVAGVGTAVGVGVSSIWNYIESNSGCFMKKQNGSVCKVQELSCCQKATLDNVANCAGMEHYQNVCEHYDEDQEQSCCKLCSCDHVGCYDQEEVRCQKPTVADALTHFAESVQSGVWSAVESVFPWASYVLYAALTLLALWLLNLALPFIKKMVPRKRNQDV